MEIQKVTSNEKNTNKRKAKPSKIQIIKFAIGVVIGIAIYLTIKLIF